MADHGLMSSTQTCNFELILDYNTKTLKLCNCNNL